MDDDRLASELQRRASGASLRPDWAQRDLLPAVWGEVDARPQPVLASRWSPLAGLATLVVALLVLVVAVPRLAPNQSASPTPTDSLVLSTVDFAAQLAAGDLFGRTVLVQGSIQTPAGPAAIGAPCAPPPSACYMGELAKTEPAINIAAPLTPTTDLARAYVVVSDGWRFWHLARPPIEGTLLLAVSADGAVQFLGVSRAGQTGLMWSVTDAAAIDVNSFGLDEVVLVDGWLFLGDMRNCGAPHQDELLRSLPDRYCGNAMLLNTGSPDDGQRLQVQNDAYGKFAVDPGEVQPIQPRHGIYAVAPRLEGWCAGAQPPCRQWTVVARVDAIVATTPTPSPSVSTVPSSPSGHLSVSEFAAQFASGELNGHTVVVDGHIGPNMRYGPLCGPFQETATRCYVGPLEGTDPVIDVYAHWTQTTEADGGASTTGMRWKWWHFLLSSGEGPLLLAVPSAGQVDFLGTVRSQGSGDAWSATAVAGLDISTIGLDEIRLVDAWLTGEKDLAARCAWQPRVDVLPSRGGCSYPAWLTDHPDVTGFTVDDLTVQGRAYENYSPTPGQFDVDGKTAVPQRGVYAVARRLYGDGCGELPPCWGWSIVARVDGLPGEAPTPEPTSAPTPTASTLPLAPQQVQVLTTDQFATALEAGGLRGKTVLVDGSVPEVGFGTFCSPPPPDFVCSLGVLTGTDPPIRVRYERWAEKENEGAQFSGGDITWPWWGGPDWPVEGTLLLRVTDDGQVQFVGRARDPEQELVRSVADVAALDVNSIDQEEVLLVDGWLNGIDSLPFCTAPRFPRVEGLPSHDWCNRGAWLMAEGTPLNPSNFSIPPGSIVVQSQAFDEFAPQPGLRDGRVVVPQRAIYAITRRLFGDGRGDYPEPPNWGWAVVGRVD